MDLITSCVQTSAGSSPRMSKDVGRLLRWCSGRAVQVRSSRTSPSKVHPRPVTVACTQCQNLSGLDAG